MIHKQRSFSLVLLLGLVVASISSGAVIRDTTTLIDVFPLKSRLQYTYEYYSRLEGYTLGFELEVIFVDSGTVEYVVHDSTLSGDTARYWDVEERQRISHRRDYLGEDTTFLTTDTSHFSLCEALKDHHELSAPGLIWHFPLTYPDTSLPISRFADSSAVEITNHWSNTFPYCWESVDSLSLSDSSGFYEQVSHCRSGCGMEYSIGYTRIQLRGSPVLDVRDPMELPIGIEVAQNYPNPFNPSTRISLSVAHSQKVSIIVYNILGQSVATLIDGELLSPGEHEYIFDGTALPTGIYLGRIRTAGSTKVVKLVLVR